MCSRWGGAWTRSRRTRSGMRRRPRRRLRGSVPPIPRGPTAPQPARAAPPPRPGPCRAGSLWAAPRGGPLRGWPVQLRPARLRPARLGIPAAGAPWPRRRRCSPPAPQWGSTPQTSRFPFPGATAAWARTLLAQARRRQARRGHLPSRARQPESRASCPVLKRPPPPPCSKTGPRARQRRERRPSSACPRPLRTPSRPLGARQPQLRARLCGLASLQPPRRLPAPPLWPPVPLTSRHPGRPILAAKARLREVSSPARTWLSTATAAVAAWAAAPCKARRRPSFPPPLPGALATRP
mmetsp:Transcript_11431/g.44216  ORF Transcript_11431/g.44216 Transcript_11431/m.44216 type:complete len:295 (-) Transcript_11431:1427-2311(-)